MDISQTTGRSRSVLPARKIFAGKKKIKKISGLPRRRAGLRRGFGEGSSTHLFVGPAAAIPTFGCVSTAGREWGRQLRFLLGSQFTQQLWKGERRKSPCVNLRENVQNPKNPGFTHCPASFQLSKLPFGGAASQEQPRLHEEGAVAGQARNKC